MVGLRTRQALLLAALFALLSIACFALPLYVIWPFRHQGVTELGVALFVVRVGPWVSIISAIVCALLAAFAFFSTRKWLARTAAVCVFLFAGAGAYLTRVNVYEHMFHHLDAPQFEAANHANLDPDDMVIALRVKGASRAYPIRELAYHHVANDTVGGRPVVATY